MWMDDDEDKIDEVKLRQRKARAREIIQEARKSLPRTRKLWSKTAKKIIEKIIDSETRERRGDVQNLKSHLMKCGYPVCKQRLKDAERKFT